MKLLLDTCAFLWFVSDSPALSAKVRVAICDEQNEVYLSAVSAWEISRKYAQGQLELPERPEVLIPELRNESGIETLPLTEEDALTAEKLPMLHRDPFDRMLIAQALVQGMVIVTSDRAFAQYPVRVLW
ncbi:type II toxin-antitoxin system VapC family toxin [Bryobacter aggregatus]|uniref:type II toxin-antitoxin system VapC family toxin n=1 Tax=Bryobacter aggregatus TaxID=360054 RepID=UPI0004E1F828|nr:type II toxin-antitoxin system VapC family toxin [Bryobacter aggregatus]